MTQPHIKQLDSLSNPTLVYNQRTFTQMINHLRQQSLVAIDTESDSLFSYYPKVCLIQITTLSESPASARASDHTARQDGQDAVAAPAAPEVVDYIVDPIRLQEIGALGSITAHPDIEIIMHAASNDIATLQRDFGFDFNHIFDTQLAARILGWSKVGLAAILEEHFGVISDKRMQRTNWGRRPLTPQQLTYAQMDTHFLPALRRILIDELNAQDRVEEADEAFALLAEADYQERSPSERTFWNMKAARSVDRQHTGVLEALWEWREQEAQQQNRPPFKIMTDKVLAYIAEHRPRSLAELQKVRSLGNSQVQRYGKDVLKAARAGAKRPLPDLPEQRSRPESMLEKSAFDRYEALRSWRTHAARTRGVDPDIVFTNDILLTIAKEAPCSEAALRNIEQIGPWKARTYGQRVLDIVARHPDEDEES